MHAARPAPAPDAEDPTRPPVVEVLCLFEDTVLAAHHLGEPPRGAASRVLLAAGGGLAGVALCLFLWAYVRVAQNPVALGPSPLFDAVALLGLVGGAALVALGLARRHRERAPRALTLGAAPGVSHAAPAELLPADPFPLVRPAAGGWQLVFTAQMSGEVRAGGRVLQLAELAASGLAHPAPDLPGAFAWPMADGAQARVVLGESTFLVSQVAAPRRQAQPLAIDWRQQTYTAGAALAAGLTLALAAAIPPDPHSLSLDDFLKNGRPPIFLVKAPEPETPPAATPAKDATRGSRAAGGRAMGPSGRMGKPTAKSPTGLYAIKGPRDNVDIKLAKQIAEDQARKAGILGIVSGSHIGAIFGSDSALGRDAEDAMGGLIGTEIGEAYGSPDALGLVGSGRGGGGTNRTIGLTDLPTIGKSGLHPGGDYGRHIGAIPADRKKEARIEPVPGPTSVTPGFDKELVRRVVRRHMNEIRYCYQKELQRKPNLLGRIVSSFAIGENGAVLSSTIASSTVGDAEVEGCVAQAVRRWEFPKPVGTRLVMVQYPFVFKPVGE